MMQDGQHLPLTVPVGGIVKVALGRLNENQLVNVEWQGKPLLMFAVDLRDRGELVKREQGLDAGQRDIQKLPARE